MRRCFDSLYVSIVTIDIIGWSRYNTIQNKTKQISTCLLLLACITSSEIRLPPFLSLSLYIPGQEFVICLCVWYQDVMLGHAIIMLCYAMSCYVMLCYAMLCYAMQSDVMQSDVMQSDAKQRLVLGGKSPSKQASC